MPKPATLRRRAQRLRAKERLANRGRCAGIYTPELVAKLNETLKAIYLPAIKAQMEHESALLHLLEADKGEFSGNYFVELPFSMRRGV